MVHLDIIGYNLLKRSVNNLVKAYSGDLEESLCDELEQFIAMVQVGENKKLIIIKNLSPTFQSSKVLSHF